MNQALKELYHLPSRNERRIVGLMSGTSADGLDIALCTIAGAGRATKVSVDSFTSLPYTDEDRDELVRITRSETADPEELVIWHDHIARLHAGMILAFLKEAGVDPADVDLLASHGHTFHHAPKSKHNRPDKPHATMQIGDGDHLAYLTGITTVSDFRQADIARGGEGAPLAGYGDWLMFGHPEKDRVLINIGGIANLTWLPAASEAFPPLSYDTGPGNTLMDAVVRETQPGRTYDRDAALAQKGKVDEEVLRQMKAHRYFHLAPPKTTGYETFHRGFMEECGGFRLSAEDLLATLNRLTADTIAAGVLSVMRDPENTEIMVSGGGLHNPLLMESLREQLDPARVGSAAEIGIDPDAKEAVIFAVLANELICGDRPELQLGKVSLVRE